MLRDVRASVTSKKFVSYPTQIRWSKISEKITQKCTKRKKTRGHARCTPNFQQTENMNIRTCKLQCTLARKPLSSSLYWCELEIKSNNSPSLPSPLLKLSPSKMQNKIRVFQEIPQTSHACAYMVHGKDRNTAHSWAVGVFRYLPRPFSWFLLGAHTATVDW